jgi:signal transduction histidine kinase/CheY-like chemotaxis protein
MRLLTLPDRPYIWLAALALGALAAQWLLYPWVGTRIPFLCFLPSIALATVTAGYRGGGLLLIVGLCNALVLKAPTGTLSVDNLQDRIAIAAYAIVGILLIILGNYHRRALLQTTATQRDLIQTQRSLQQQVSDLGQLHELSTDLASLHDLQEQMKRILAGLKRLHGADLGLLSMYERNRSTLRVVASIGFSDEALQLLHCIKPGDRACDVASAERRRIIVEDTEQDPRTACFREIARGAGFRAVHSTPLLTQSGEVLGAITVLFRTPRRPTEREIALADICARKAAVFIERAYAEAHVEEQDRNLRTVLDASAVPFSILGPIRDDSGAIVDFKWLYVNAAACRVSQRSETDLVGYQISQVLPGTWDAPGLFERYVSALERSEVTEFELASTAQGITGWFHIVASPLDGSLAIWFAEITGRKLAEQALREADRRKDEFLATLAHELRNPLAPIRQAAMIVAQPTATEAQRRWAGAVVERQVQHMSLLLDDLLDVSRITRGRLSLRKRRVDLRSIVSAAIETARLLIDSKQHELIVQLPQGNPQVHADPVRLAQILSNLLTNAAKYTDPKGSIRLTAVHTGNTAVLSVADNGIGIANENLHSIFHMFSQVKSAQERSEGGLGIGLALTKGLVELHGGSIEVASEGLGRGSSFTVSLPIIVAAEPLTAVHVVEEHSPRRELTRRILVADDNRDAADSLALLLRESGHHVDVASDGAAAYEAYRAHRPEVLLLDIGMPKLSGYEIAKRVRAEGGTSLLIAITGWGQDSDRAKATCAGFDHHLTKPVDYIRLTRLLQLEHARETA